MDNKYRYVFQHEDTGRFLFKYFTLIEIENNQAPLFQDEIGPRWCLIARDQYTGQKDKKYNEIYLGDIIKECTINSLIWDETGIIEECPYGEVIFHFPFVDIKQIKKGKVRLLDGHNKYINDGNGYSDVNMSIYDGSYLWPKDIEKIGNKYENPELINK